MIVGGFAPWATAFGGALSVSGTNGDGWFLIIGGILAGGLLTWHESSPRVWKAILIAVIALIGTIVSVVDLSNIRSVAGQSSGLVQVGWGLYVSLVSSIGLLAAGLYTIVKRPYVSDSGALSTEASTARADEGGVRAATPHGTPPPSH